MSVYLRVFVVALMLLAAAAACSKQRPVPVDDASLPSAEEPATPAPESGTPESATQENSKEGESGASERLEATVVATDLAAPWGITIPPDQRVFLTERDRGRVVEYVDGHVRIIRNLPVDATGEGGLLGITHSPEFETDNLLYVYYTTEDDNRIARFAPDSDAPADVIFSGIPRARIHNGGRIAFGPDGMLYVGTGDASVPERSQAPDSLAGKILRMTSQGGIPDDNPSPDSYVYTLGHRNVQGLTWDSQGRMYATEFGPGRDDEINLIEAGNNYGWPEVTGQANQEGFRDPIFVQQPADASWSGMTALVQGAIPGWEDQLIIASLRGQRLWRLELSPDGQEVVDSEALFMKEWGRLRAVVQAADGSLWVLTNNRDGRGIPRKGDDHIYRLAHP
ncbi:glucose sorbosone dehydrogenase [Lujinxingia litoralis]|uniref:Glucose sorbosone dehydrogenase n=1 Tax=Lujinxingia litoralis TaxID=2211119 RepID=A0A328CAF1_9DELT|nr:PQQ-dependent sugar dehydrogenase [Lujinxingia litoralis]RAL22843.1 glucose sorbosone dehydrogenase [Lujinxingia litoralis]